MRNLIIGCGYLGSRVAAAWLEQGHEVNVLTRSRERAGEFRQQRLRPVVGDVTRPASLESLPAADAVLYAVAWDRSGGQSRRQVLIDGLECVLDALSDTVRKLVFISSTSVYGQTSGELVDEDSDCNPKTENGRICLEAERRVADFAARHPATQTVILRLAGIYGPNRLLQRVAAVRAAEPIAGRPDAWLNLIHVEDAVSTVLGAVESNSSHTTWLVSDGHPVQRRTYYEMLARFLAAPAPRFEASPEADTTRTHGLNKRCVNLRMLAELGVPLKFPRFEDGLRASIDPTEGEASQ